MKYMFFISLIVIFIIVIIFIITILLWDYIWDYIWEKRTKNRGNNLKNREQFNNQTKLCLHIILLKDDFDQFLKEIKNIINLSNVYYKNIDIYLHSNDKFMLKNNIIFETYNHNYQNGKIIKIIHDMEYSVENIKTKMSNMLKRHEKEYDIIISLTKKDFTKLKKILLENNNSEKLKKID